MRSAPGRRSMSRAAERGSSERPRATATIGTRSPRRMSSATRATAPWPGGMTSAKRPLRGAHALLRVEQHRDAGRVEQGAARKVYEHARALLRGRLQRPAQRVAERQVVLPDQRDDRRGVRVKRDFHAIRRLVVVWYSHRRWRGLGRPDSGASLQRSEGLHRLAAALSRAERPRDVGIAFLDQALERLGAQGGSLVLRSADGSALELIAGRDLPGAKARPARASADRGDVQRHRSPTGPAVRSQRAPTRSSRPSSRRAHARSVTARRPSTRSR